MRIIAAGAAFLVLLAAAAYGQDDERTKRIVDRIEKEIRDSHARTRAEILAIILTEIQKSAGRPAVRPAVPSEARPSRAVLGISAEDLTEADQKALAGSDGVRVAEVRGAAKEAGLRPGDLLVELDGEGVNEERIAKVLSRHKPGDTVGATVLRQKKRITLQIVLGERKD